MIQQASAWLAVLLICVAAFSDGRRPVPQEIGASGTDTLFADVPFKCECCETSSFANPKDCRSYYGCIYGQPVKYHCGNINHVYDREEGRCRPKSQATCTVTDLNFPSHGIACQGKHPHFVPNPLHCGSLFRCLGGKPRLIFCPEGLEYDKDAKLCDVPEKANCVAEELPTERDPSTAEIRLE